MPLFAYRALDSGGSEERGQIEADTAISARTLLLDRGIYPIDIKEKVIEEKEGRSKLFQRNLPTKKQITLLTRQIATLLGSSVPLAASLQSVAEQADDGKIKGLLHTLLEHIKEGRTFAESLGDFPSLFPEMYVNIVHSGEESGALSAAIESLADHLEEEEKLMGKVKNSLTYPLLMSLMATMVVIFLMTFIVPKITSIFDSLGHALPLSTRILIGFSWFLGHFWYLILALFGIIFFLFRKYTHTPEGLMKVDTAKLRIPLFGKLHYLVSMNRLASTLSTLLASGLTIEQALNIGAGTSGNVHIRGKVKNIRDLVVEGASLASSLKQEKIFPSTLTQMVGVGEESGNLSFMLKKAASSLERDYENLLERFLSLIEPVIILLMGGVVAFIVISVMLPLLNLSQIIK